ncbi:MAG: hypothetical protein M0P93_04775 [Candidatus Cloacimonetes bacterium]|nr:hypothetical protein [Candidatus Cloacimonadota bacterium]
MKLVRFNGKHKRMMDEIDDPHFYFHIHRENDIENSLNTLKDSVKTDEYSSFEEALNYALKTVNVQNYREYFKDTDQLEIF